MTQVKELLIEELRDLLHAENQLVSALPKMVNAARNPKLGEVFEKHLIQTEQHVQRLNKAFELLGADADPKPCRGMMGLLEEGQEVIEEGRTRRTSSPTWLSSPPPRRWSITRSPATAPSGSWPARSASTRWPRSSTTPWVRRRAPTTS
jgi:hypothetical protein